MAQLGSIFVFAGFFSSYPIRVALVTGLIVAVVSGTVGTFTIIRGQSFAGHSLADIGAAGGSAAYLVNIPAIYGFIGINILAGLVLELIGIGRLRGRDLAAGIVLSFSLGLTALFLYLDTIASTTTNVTASLLFGSILTIQGSSIPIILAVGSVAIAIVMVLYRPLVLSSISKELALAKGIPETKIAIGYLVALALNVSLTAITVGAILSTALLVGPAVIALKLTRRPGRAILLASAIGVFVTWIGIYLSYDSYYWPPHNHGWPASFFVVAIIFALFVIVDTTISVRRKYLVGERAENI